MITKRTFLNEQLQQFDSVKDPQVNEFLQRVRADFCKRVYVQEMKIRVKKGWFRRELVTRYEFYWRLKQGEVQEICMLMGGVPTTLVTKDMAIAYLMGFYNSRQAITRP